MKRWWPFYALAFTGGLLLARVLAVWQPVASAPNMAAARSTDAVISTPAPKSASVPSERLYRFFRPVVPSSPRSSWPPLPDGNAPLVAILPILKARANQGDASAACRLSAELSWCAQARKLPIHNANANARARKGDQNVRSHCSGVDESVLQERFSFLRQAALGGSLAAIEHYVSATDMISDADVAAEFLEAYQREAPKLAEAALQAGSVAMLSQLENAYGNLSGDSWLSRAQTIRWDPARRVLLQKLQERVLPKPSHPDATASDNSPWDEKPIDAASLSPEAISKLDAKAEAWHQQWFQGRTAAPTVGPFDYLAVYQRRPDFNDACSKRYIEHPLDLAPVAWPEMAWP